MIIQNIEIKQTKTGKDYKSVLLDDDRRFNVFSFHSKYEDISIGSEIAPTDLEKDGNYWGLKDLKKEFKAEKKTEQINQVMQRKETAIKSAQIAKTNSIKDAQDRNDVLWAKRSAAELVAFHPSFKDLKQDEVVDKIIALANKIVNSELSPF